MFLFSLISSHDSGIAAKMLALHPVDHFNKTSLQSENELFSGTKNTKTKKNLINSPHAEDG